MNNDTLNRIISNMVTLQGKYRREYRALMFRALSPYERAAVTQAIRARSSESKRAVVRLNWN